MALSIPQIGLSDGLTSGDKWLEARALGWLPDAWGNLSVAL